MRLVIELAEHESDVEVAQFAASATLRDLLQEVVGRTLGDDDVLWVDERRCAAGDRLEGLTLLEGSRVSDTPLERPTPSKDWTATLSGGPTTGQLLPVPRNRPLSVGRSPGADITIDSPSASWSHVSIAREDGGVRVRDAGSTNGTLVDGVKVPDDGVLVEEEAVVVAGGAAVTLRRRLSEPLAPPPGSLHNLTPAGTAPFNRPPRPGRAPEPEPLEPPTRKDDPPPSKFPIATVIGPLILAFVMVLVLGDPRFALLAALSPVLGVFTYVEQRRRRTKDIAEEDARFSAALSDFADGADQAAATERARRRVDLPDPAATLRRASLPSTLMWQRRPGAADYLSLHVGVGDVPWQPPVDNDSGRRLDDDVRELVRSQHIPSAPIAVDLDDAGVVGIVGDREGALALARSLVCQAAVHSGPADLTVGVFCDQGREEAWAWTTWLPHVRRVGDVSHGQWVGADRTRSETLLRALRDSIDSHPTPTVLLVIDSDVLTEGRDAPARVLLGQGRRGDSTSYRERPATQVAGIVIASSTEQLPSACTMIVEVAADAQATVTTPDDLVTVDDVVVAGVDTATARRCARDLARFEDPELVVPGSALPSMVRLPPLLGLEEISAEEIRRSWAAPTGMSTPVGVGESGTFGLDLVRDGPHGLVGGTTGSGKSEFLRSMVAGLAARNDPTRLTFILIDFKGGAAFATCERLPHTIGTVSNLDEQLADRALRALEAEMAYRQRVFAAAGEGVDNLSAYLATNPEVPMPRLLLVVDEFAQLAKQYPDVLSSLVSVAAVGRTLGVHMILATQRPAGVVNEDILANTNLRVALRVQSRDDSVNVVGVPTAAAIGRDQMGRGFVKLGENDISPVQTALVTGQAQAASSAVVDAHAVGFAVDADRTTPAAAVPDSDVTDLDLIIDAIVEANDQAGYPPPRPVWPEPLGDRVELAVLLDTAAAATHAAGAVRGDRVEFALSDDPGRQRQVASGWDLDRGNLLLLGIPGSGTSTTLASIALTMTSFFSPDDLDVLVLDLGARDLAALEDLPHVTGYVGSGPGSRERQVRLLKYVRAELERRRAAPGPHRRMVVLIDGLAALRDDFDDFEGLKLLEGLYRAWTEGPEVRMWFAASSSRSKAIPAAIDEVTTQKWLFRLADPYDYSSAGINPRQVPAAVPGRCVPAETKLQTHVAASTLPLAAAVAEVQRPWGSSAAKATVVGQLPDRITVAELGVPARIDGEPWYLPVGVAENDLEAALLPLWEGEHMLVSGPARSGRSTLLAAIAESLRAAAAAAGTDLQVWGICGRRSPLASASLDQVCVGEDGRVAMLASLRVHTGRVVLLVDDAEQYDDGDQAFAGLLGSAPHVTVIAAGRSDDLRTLYSHWTKVVRKSRCGVLLQPNVDYDGELLGVALPRQSPVAMTPGRGYAAAGGALGLVQCLSPSSVVPVVAD